MSGAPSQRVTAALVLRLGARVGSVLPCGGKTRAPTVYGRQTIQIMLCRAFWPNTRTQDVILWAHGGGCVVSAHVRVMLCVVVIIPTLGRACKRLGERPAL